MKNNGIVRMLILALSILLVAGSGLAQPRGFFSHKGERKVVNAQRPAKFGSSVATHKKSFVKGIFRKTGPLSAVSRTGSQRSAKPGFSKVNVPGSPNGISSLGDVVSMESALVAGANYVKTAQSSTDGGWDWVLTAPQFTHSSDASADNLYGATALGMYYAYLKTSDPALLTAMLNAADHMVANTDVKDASALRFLMLLNDVPGVTGTSYKDAAKAKYDAQLAAHGGTAAAFAQYVRDVRGIDQGYHNGIIGWDLGAWAVAAQMLFVRYAGGYHADAGAIAQVAYDASFVANTNYFDLVRCAGWDPGYANSDYYWYNLGVSGLIDAFNSSGTHSSDIPGLVLKLQNSQASFGGFCGSYGIHDNDDDWQTTAYAVMSLASVDPVVNASSINHGDYYLAATQDGPSGAWIYSDGTHYPEVGGECTSALYFGKNASVVWVDLAYSSLSCGGHLWGYDGFASIQNAVGAVAPGGTVNIDPGTYNVTQVNIDRPLTLQGAGAGSTIIDGGGNATTLSTIGTIAFNGISSGSIWIDGITLRNGGNCAYWGTASACLLSFTSTSASVTVQHSQFLGRNDASVLDFGMYFENGVLPNVQENEFRQVQLPVAGYITGTTTIRRNSMNEIAYEGIELTADLVDVNDVTVSENYFGLLLNASAIELDGSSPLYPPAAYIRNAVFAQNTVVGQGGDWSFALWLAWQRCVGTQVTQNVFSNLVQGVYESGNWGDYATGTIVTGNSFVNVAYPVLSFRTGPPYINASANWWGTNDPSGVEALFPVTGPFPGYPDLNASLVDYSPWFDTGTDAAPAIPGFQGDYSNLWVTWTGQQSGSTGRIQEGVNLVTGTSNRVYVAPGTYSDPLNIAKPVSLIGAGAATTIINRGGSGNCITFSSPAAFDTVSGFTLTNGQNGISGSVTRLLIKNCTIHDNVLNGIAFNGSDFNSIQSNSIYGHSAGSGVLLSGSQQNAVTSNTLHDNQYNVTVAQAGVRPARGNVIQSNTFVNPGTWSVQVLSDPLTTKVNFNIFNTPVTHDKYVSNSSAVNALNAEWNWFDGIKPPNPAGFSGLVDNANAFATNTTVTVLPTGYVMPLNSPLEVSVIALLPAGLHVKGATVGLTWNNAVTQRQNLPVQGPFLPGSQFFSTLLNANSISVDQAILGLGYVGNPPGGLPYLGPLFSIDYSSAANGTSTFTLSSVDLRDEFNNSLTPIDLVHNGVVTVDGTSPAVQNVLIRNNSIDNNNYVKNTDNLTVTATVTDNNTMVASNITADLSAFYNGSGHTADAPSSYTTPAGLATWTIAGAVCHPSDGSITIPVTAYDLAGNSASSSDDIVADNTPPSSATNLTAKTLSPGGNQKVTLAWTAGSDAHYRGVQINYSVWPYPLYTSATNPGYPSGPGAGTPLMMNKPAVDYVHQNAARGIYYYSAFAVDSAMNYALLDPSAQDFSANYYLGDLGSGTGPAPGAGYDGRVNFDDLQWFAAAYYSINPTGTTAEADFAPTVANKTYGARSPFGVPQPDQRVNFEDLMIFALNYNVVVPKLPPPAVRDLNSQLAVELYPLREQSGGNEYLDVRVKLANDGSSIKGAAVTVKFDPALLAVETISGGSVFGLDGYAAYFHRVESNTIQLDAAMLGYDRTVEWSGDLAALRFKVLQPGKGQVTIDKATLRTGDNGEQTPQLRNEVKEVPTAFALEQNYPNPFNPSTSIKFQVPVAGQVELSIFNILGQKVATLVNEAKDAGFYSVVWNGRNSLNQPVGSGTYFYSIKAGKFSSIRKMVLVK